MNACIIGFFVYCVRKRHIGAGYIVILVARVYQSPSKENNDGGLRLLCINTDILILNE